MSLRDHWYKPTRKQLMEDLFGSLVIIIIATIGLVIYILVTAK